MAALSRHLVYSRRGMVCSNSPLAASAGLKVFQEGGNAFEAALAVAAVETVTLVPMCGLGGDSFVLLYEAKSGTLTGINSSGIAASGAHAASYRAQGYRTMPLQGPHAVSVPGEVAAWESIHQRFCNKPFAQLLDSAIGYASEGFPLPPGISRNFASNAPKLAKFPTTAAVLLPYGIPREGDILRNPDLARSLQIVAQGGASAFYCGELTQRMIQGLHAAGGTFTAADFAGHQAEMYDPIATTYRGRTVYQTRPPSQGFLLLEMLNLVEGFPLSTLGQNSAEAIHLMVEAKKLAYADRNRLAGDPCWVDWPLEELIAKSYADQRRPDIHPQRVNAQLTVAPSVEVGGDTTYFCVADGDGNCVSWIHSLSNAFGSCYIAEGTGILFNNRAGRGFSLEAGHPNEIAPGKRTMHTLNCYMVMQDGQPVVIGGTPGGDFQPQGNLQILTNLFDFGMDPQAAIEAPRWWSFPGTDPETLHRTMELRVEAEMPEEVTERLTAMGHHIVRRHPGVYDGKMQLIVRDPQRQILMGASDPRGDGHAVGL